MVSYTTKTLLLSGVVVLYLLAGAGIFHLLESPSELKRQQAAARTVKSMVGNLTCIQPGEIRQLIVLSKDLRRASFSFVNDTLTIDPGPTLWDFPSTMFFCNTVLTTIGYGQLTPQTVGGRAFCVVYALFGIPLYLILLSRIGPNIARFNENMADRIFKLQVGSYRRDITQFLLLFFVGSLFMLFIPSIVFTFSEGWPYGVSLYYSFITLSTIGFGDYVAGWNSQTGWKILFSIWIPVGLSWFSALITTVQEMLTEKIECEQDNANDKPDQKAEGAEKTRVVPLSGPHLCEHCGSRVKTMETLKPVSTENHSR